MILILFYFLIIAIFPNILFSDIDFWTSYGGLSWERSFNENYYSPYFSAYASCPQSSLTYGFIYQIIEVDPTKVYGLNLWLNNITMKSAGGIFGFRENKDFYANSFKSATDLDGDGENDDNSEKRYCPSTSGTWQNIIVTNCPGSLYRKWVKIGLRVLYGDGDINVKAYFDNVRFYPLDNTNINLLQNGNFEYGWNYGLIPEPREENNLHIYPKIFTPNGFDRLCSITIKLQHTPCELELKLYTLSGDRKKTFYHGTVNTLLHYFLWDGRDEQGSILPMGIYIIKMKILDKEKNQEKEVKTTVVLGNKLR